MTIEDINIPYTLPKPFRQEVVYGTIEAEIFEPFAIYKSYRNPGKYTLCIKKYARWYSNSVGHFDTIEEARRAAKRLMKVKTITWNDMIVLRGGYNGFHEESKYDDHYLHTIFYAVSDEGYAKKDLREHLKKAQEGYVPFYGNRVDENDSSIEWVKYEEK